jgi:hypothetical protein
MKKMIDKLYAIVFVLLATSFYSLSASASIGLCMKKEISSDGVTWYDANVQAEAVVISSTAHFQFSVFKCPTTIGGFTALQVTDPQLGFEAFLVDLPESGVEYPVRVETFVALGYCDGLDGYKENIAEAIGVGQRYGNTHMATDNAWALCQSIPQGGEGCTPGYWKQPQHAGSWPVDLNTTFMEIFDRSIEIKIRKQGTILNPTLLEALSASGGKTNMAARHAVAAYLNAESVVNYDMSPTAVIEAFQNSEDSENFGVLIQNLIDFNEQGCPLN